MADNLFGDLERQYGLPAGYLARTYQIESGSGANLYNPLSKAAGGFQFIPSTAKQYGLKDPYDLAQSADAAARLAADNRAALQKAGIENPSAAQLYLAHQQGASGANKLLGGGDTKATDIVGEKAVLWNAGKASMTGPEFAERIMTKFEGTTPAAASAGYTPPWSNAASALGDIDKKYLGGGFGFLGKQASNLLGMLTPEGSASLPAAAPSPIGFTEPMQRFGATLPQSLMGSQPPGGVGPMATAGGGQAAMAAVPLAPKDTGFSIDNLNAGQAAGFAGLGNALMAAGAPKMTWKPSGEAAPIHRGQWRDDIFAGLLGPSAWG